MPDDCVTGAPPFGYEASYYQAGHLAEVVRGTEANFYGYAPGGKLALEGRVEPSGSGCMDVTYYSYDGNGNITSIKYPAADPTDSALARQINYVHGGTGDDPDAIREVELVTASGTTTLLKNVDKPAFAGGYTFAYVTTDSCGSPTGCESGPQPGPHPLDEGRPVPGDTG
jgi:hypothetical protein